MAFLLGRAKMDSISDRKRLFDSDVENTALKKKIQDVSAEAEEPHVKIVLVSVKLEVEMSLK